MWQDLIKYRGNLKLIENVSFGLEIEFVNANRSYVDDEVKSLYDTGKISKPWELVNEETLYDGDQIFSTRGGEAVSDIFHDTKSTWNDLDKVCCAIKKYNGKISQKCGGHVHIGANILEDNLKYYSRLAKLYVVYEDVLLRFNYGELDYPRDNLYKHAESNFSIFRHIDLFYKNDKQIRSFDEFVKAYSIFKNMAISFRRLDKNFVLSKYNGHKEIKNWYDYRTLEFRSGMGTLNKSIWQNYVNVDTKMMLCCLDDNKDWDYIDRLFYDTVGNHDLEEFSDKYNLSRAISFCNFVFDEDIDKLNFLRQYIKSDAKLDKNVLVRKKKS